MAGLNPAVHTNEPSDLGKPLTPVQPGSSRPSQPVTPGSTSGSREEGGVLQESTVASAVPKPVPFPASCRRAVKGGLTGSPSTPCL